MDQLQCSGMEESLLECNRFAGLGLHSCDHSQEAGVSCIGKDAVECVCLMLDLGYVTVMPAYIAVCLRLWDTVWSLNIHNVQVTFVSLRRN